MRLRVAFMVLGLAVLSGCQPGASAEPTGSLSELSSSEAAASGTSSASSAPSSSAAPVDPRIAAAQEKLECTWNTLDVAYQNPGHDWYVDIRKCAGDPYLSGVLQDLKYFAAHGVYSVGVLKREILSAIVVLDQPASVEFTFCVDQSASEIVNAQGETLPNPPETYRNLAKLLVVDYGGTDGYLVQQNLMTEETAASC